MDISDYWQTSISVYLSNFGNNAVFYNTNSLWNRSEEPLLSKPEALELIEKLCNFYDQYDQEIEAYNKEYTKPAPPLPPRLGQVYLMESGGLYKIGYTYTSVRARRLTFQRGNPKKVNQICIIDSDSPEQLEKELHDKFAKKHVRGEWFDLNAADVEYMQSLAEVSS